MSNYHPVHCKIWQDTKFMEYKSLRKLVFLYLITNPHCKITGIYEVSPKTISHETDIEVEQVRSILRTFNPDSVVYDFDTGVVYIKNFLKYHFTKIGNPVTINSTILNNLSLTPHVEFWNDFEKRYQEELEQLRKKVKEINSNKKKRKLKVVT